MDHEKAYAINPNYQAILHALSLRTDGLTYGKENLFRHLSMLRFLWAPQLNAFTCSQYLVSWFSACGFQTAPYSTPAMVVELGPFTRDENGDVIGHVLVADESAKFRLFKKKGR
jgi:hypothetical protein